MSLGLIGKAQRMGVTVAPRRAKRPVMQMAVNDRRAACIKEHGRKKGLQKFDKIMSKREVVA